MHTDAIINESNKNKKVFVPYHPTDRPGVMVYDEFGSSTSLDLSQDPAFIEQEQRKYQDQLAKKSSCRNMINDDGNVTHWENSISHPYRDVPVDRPYLDHSFTDDNEQKNLLAQMH